MLVISQENIFPLKKLTPNIPNSRKKINSTIIRFIKLGMDDRRELIANLRPAFLYISLNGLRILTDLRTLS